MTSFVHVEQPTHHAGVVRAERAIHTVRHLIRPRDTSRATASLLLAAIVAALMVVANQVIDTWTDGPLLAAWIAMWAVAFAALAVLAVPVKRLADGVRQAFARWTEARHRAVEDEKLWDLAVSDARVMADISRSMSADAIHGVKAYR